jgi:hypothetical protein
MVRSYSDSISFLFSAFAIGVARRARWYAQVFPAKGLTRFWNFARFTKGTLGAHQFPPGRCRALYGKLRLDADFIPKLIPEGKLERQGHALDVFLRNWLKTSRQDHTLNQVPAMEPKWEAVIQYFGFMVRALAQLADRPSEIETFEYDLVIKFSGHCALFRQDQPGSPRDQAQPNGVAGPTTRQVENQAGEASDNRDVQGRNIFQRIVGTIDIDSLGSQFSQAPAVFPRFCSTEAWSEDHDFLPKKC